jgi:hypothetical protein
MQGGECGRPASEFIAQRKLHHARGHDTLELAEGERRE